MPALTDPPWFAFLVHPRGTRDLLRSGLGRVLRDHSSGDAEFLAKVCALPPMVVGEMRFGFGPCHGELVCAMCMPGDMLGPRGEDAVVRTAQVAAERGAAVLGLGALTAPATGGGQRLLHHLPAGVTLTNGNAYTAVVARDNVLEAAAFASRSTNGRVAVVGCTGAVGMAASRLLADSGVDLILVGRSSRRAESALGTRAGRAVFSGEIAAVRDAGVVLLLTSSPAARLTRDMVSPGTVVIDMAEPDNVSREDRAAFASRDVEVVDGGFVRLPGYTCTFELGAPTPADTFACLAETYLFAREGIREHSVGRPAAEQALAMERVARRHGVRPAPLELLTPAPARAADRRVPVTLDARAAG